MSQTKPVDKKLLAILACPQCKAPVTPEGDGLRCTRPECRLLYPVLNGVPVMLISEAKKNAP